MVIIVYLIMFGIFHTLTLLIIDKLITKKIDFTLIGLILTLTFIYAIIVSFFGINIRKII